MSAPAILPASAEPRALAVYEAVLACSCGSHLRQWLRPDPARPGWWHAACVRCCEPYYWRPA